MCIRSGLVDGKHRHTAEDEIFETWLGRGRDGDGIPVAAQGRTQPEDVDLRNGGGLLRFAAVRSRDVFHYLSRQNCAVSGLLASGSLASPAARKYEKATAMPVVSLYPRMERGSGRCRLTLLPTRPVSKQKAHDRIG